MLKKLFIKAGILIILSCLINQSKANSGYKLWLEYNKITDRQIALKYKQRLQFLDFHVSSPQLETAHAELLRGLGEMLGLKSQNTTQIMSGQTLMVGTIAQLKLTSKIIPDTLAGKIGSEGYLI